MSLVKAKPVPTIRCASTRMVSLPWALGQIQELVGERERLVELGAVAVQPGQAAQHREELRDLTLSLEEREGAPVLLLDLVRQPVQALSARARLVRSVSSCSARSRVGGVVATTSKSSPARSPSPGSDPATRTRATDPSIELVEPVEVALTHPVAPRAAQVLGVGGQRGEGRVAAVAGDALPLPAREVGEVRGVRPAGGGIELGAFVKALGRVLPDRRQHHEPGVAVRAGLAHEALVDERGEAVEGVEIDAAVQGRGDGLDGVEGCAGEGGEQLEEALLAGLEQLVAPLDRGTEGLLALRPVPGAAPQQLEARVEALAAEPPARRD